MRLTQCFLFFIVAFIGLSSAYAQQDERNFKVTNDGIQKDDNLSDSVFFSIREAVVFPTKVKELSLENSGLTALPKEVFKFKNLQTLNISYNKIDSLPAELFQACPQLEVIHYAGNQLTVIPNALFRASLKVLNLSENKLTTIPNRIGACEQLEELDLHDNRLTAYPAHTVVLPSLKSLVLSGNPITSMGEWILLQPALKILFLDNTGLTALPDQLCKAEALRFLNIEENNIVTLPECFCTLKKLRVIMINGTKVSDEHWKVTHDCLPDLQIR